MKRLTTESSGLKTPSIPNIYQWRNWLLEHIGEDKYELIRKDDLTVLPIVAKDDMDAENQCQQFIKKEI